MKMFLHNVLIQSTNSANTECVQDCELENFKKYEMEEVDENLARTNEELMIKLKSLKEIYEKKKKNIVDEAIQKFDNELFNSKFKEEIQKEMLITFVDSKKERKTYNKEKLFNTFMLHHEEKLHNCENSIKDSLEDLERSINNFKEDFKKVLEKQQDLLIVSNNDGLNNLMIDFKEITK